MLKLISKKVKLTVDKCYFIMYNGNIIKRERENIMINYVDAVNGGIEMTTKKGETLWSDTVEGVAKAMYDYGIAKTMMGSSSMDFASEEGFETDEGAMLLLKRALELV
jgi:hypothetical protein